MPGIGFLMAEKTLTSIRSQKNNINLKINFELCNMFCVYPNILPAHRRACGHCAGTHVASGKCFARTENFAHTNARRQLFVENTLAIDALYRFPFAHADEWAREAGVYLQRTSSVDHTGWRTFRNFRNSFHRRIFGSTSGSQSVHCLFRQQFSSFLTKSWANGQLPVSGRVYSCIFIRSQWCGNHGMAKTKTTEANLIDNDAN